MVAPLKLICSWTRYLLSYEAPYSPRMSESRFTVFRNQIYSVQKPDLQCSETRSTVFRNQIYSVQKPDLQCSETRSTVFRNQMYIVQKAALQCFQKMINPGSASRSMFKPLCSYRFSHAHSYNITSMGLSPIWVSGRIF